MLSQERGVTVISATHDYKMLNVSDRVVWVRDGQVDRIEKREELDISIGGIGEKLTGHRDPGA
jgi:putative ABC transport system ATP-binding protein